MARAPKVDFFTPDIRGDVPPVNCINQQYVHLPSGVPYTIRGFVYSLDETWHCSLSRPGSIVRFTIPLAVMRSTHFRLVD